MVFKNNGGRKGVHILGRYTDLSPVMFFMIAIFVYVLFGCLVCLECQGKHNKFSLKTNDTWWIFKNELSRLISIAGWRGNVRVERVIS